MTALTGWENFYVIVGSSAGALIGLQFVVITLIADMPIGHGAAQAGDAFATPTIVHFGAVLLLAGVLRAIFLFFCEFLASFVHLKSFSFSPPPRIGFGVESGDYSLNLGETGSQSGSARCHAYHS